MWKKSNIAPCSTHHCVDGAPLYSKRFDFVLKFHEPGLAPVKDQTGCYHITAEGLPAYSSRFTKTFGFYCNRAAVEDQTGCYHINPWGVPVYSERYRWCGNFQSDACSVQSLGGGYFHIDLDGNRLYSEVYRYVGDYRDGYAVVHLGPKKCTHIDQTGNLLHSLYFEDLDVFHKGSARAKDKNGWFHIDRNGVPLYSQRFAQVEPFYNEVALAGQFDGAKVTIDLNGCTLSVISPSTAEPIHALSSEMVSFWKSETLQAANEIRLFDQLPNTSFEIAHQLGLSVNKLNRMMRALWELDLVKPLGDRWEHTKKSELLAPSNHSWMYAAGKIWSEVQRLCWVKLVEKLKDAKESHHPTFKETEKDETVRRMYLKALDGYASSEFKNLFLDLSDCSSISATGRASVSILNHFQHVPSSFFGLKALFPDKSSVIELDNYLEPWPFTSDAVLLTKFLHYWPDHEAKILLSNAKKAAKKRLYIIEFVLSEDHPGGSLLDLNMLVESGGMERTTTQIVDLLRSVGLNVHSMQSVGWQSVCFEVRL